MEIFVGKQLFTRDGRKVGNAIVVEQAKPALRDQNDFWKIETDFGNTMTFTSREIEEYFQDLEEDGPQVSNDLDEWRAARAATRVEITVRNTGPEGFKWIDRPAMVHGEDFTYPATVLCSFPKKSGKVRYVVEDNGRIFIQRDSQIVYTDFDESGHEKKPWKGVEEQTPLEKLNARLDQPLPKLSDYVCPICDGGPGNSCACTCTPEMREALKMKERSKVKWGDWVRHWGSGNQPQATVGVRVEVLYRDGSSFDTVYPSAGAFDWKHLNNPKDIIYYRVAKEE